MLSGIRDGGMVLGGRGPGTAIPAVFSTDHGLETATAILLLHRNIVDGESLEARGG